MTAVHPAFYLVMHQRCTMVLESHVTSHHIRDVHSAPQAHSIVTLLTSPPVCTQCVALQQVTCQAHISDYAACSFM
jgi:hypothetical protein